ncbi:MAG: hypothetical protein ACPG4N_00410 [Gammaproteobacteria bacterium]
MIGEQSARVGDALSGMQAQLESIYDLHTPHRVESFVTSNADWLRALGEQPERTEEMLLVHAEGEDLNVSLYLSQAVLAGLSDEHDPNPNMMALEGVSHFLYVVWRAARDHGMSRLELELQAEVDKFLALSADRADLRSLHDDLFSRVSFRENLSTEDRALYQEANRQAARYCWDLVSRFGEGEHPGRQRELRRFYRLGLESKVNMINGMGAGGP